MEMASTSCSGTPPTSPGKCARCSHDSEPTTTARARRGDRTGQERKERWRCCLDILNRAVALPADPMALDGRVPTLERARTKGRHNQANWAPDVIGRRHGRNHCDNRSVDNRSAARFLWCQRAPLSGDAVVPPHEVRSIPPGLATLPSANGSSIGPWRSMTSSTARTWPERARQRRRRIGKTSVVRAALERLERIAPIFVDAQDARTPEDLFGDVAAQAAVHAGLISRKQ